jgi:hypothetical protein
MFAALVISLTLAGQDAGTVNVRCRTADDVDRCHPANRATLVGALGMATIEEERGAGVEVYRVTQIDGYGRIMPGISFERRPGAPPQVVVYGHGGRRMSAVLPFTDWRTVQSRGRFADRELVPLPKSAPDEVSICLHGWSSTVEIANAVDRGVPDGKSRTRSESACDGGLATRFANDAAQLAITNLGDCDALDPDEHRNDASRLQVCLGFDGDRLAAAEVMNQTGWRLTPDNPETARAWASVLGMNSATRLDWAGTSVTGARGVAANPVAVFLAARHAESPSLRAYIGALTGVSSTRVEATGSLEMDGPGDGRLQAPFRQVWIWDPNGLMWTLQSWTVEAFQPMA